MGLSILFLGRHRQTDKHYHKYIDINSKQYTALRNNVWYVVLFQWDRHYEGFHAF